MARRFSYQNIFAHPNLHLPGEALGEALSQEALESAASGKLDERYVWPPFSVLNTAAKPWQDRKRVYMGLGIQSELGRGEEETPAIPHGGGNHTGKGANSVYGSYQQRLAQPWQAECALSECSEPAVKWLKDTGYGWCEPHAQVIEAQSKHYTNDVQWLLKPKRAKAKAFKTDAAGWPGKGDRFNGRKANAIPGGSKLPSATLKADGHTERQEGSGTSIFDPVLCELMYRWFCPPAGVVLDPFAGGSVRGLVAALWGRDYVGIDLRPEQVEANEAQRSLAPEGSRLKWIAGNSVRMDDHLGNAQFDFLFTCPPYYNLELYSYDPEDLSNAESYGDFYVDYNRILTSATLHLREDRFAALVVGNFRDKKGMTTDFVGDTIRIMEEAGLRYYNEAILLTAVGSLALRTRLQFRASRKLGKMHQQVLIFVKGDPRKAATAVRGE